MDYAGRQRADETQRIADGDGEFAGTNARGVADCCGRQIRRAES